MKSRGFKGYDTYGSHMYQKSVLILGGELCNTSVLSSQSLHLKQNLNICKQVKKEIKGMG